MRENAYALMTNVAMNANRTSDPILIDQVYGYSIQARWSGTAQGTLKLQGSCDPVIRDANTSSGGPYTVTNWTDIDDSAHAVVGMPDTFLWNADGAMYNFVRLVYTRDASSGNLNVTMIVKG